MTQKQEIIYWQRKVWGDQPQLCECGEQAKDDSCYCQDCEDELYAD